ncbi:hypothetical protein JCM30237_08930 [Halolamina litorea]|uniref:Uncharacterized protein n=1 Tax=Halolamina litorea TaxID=1515593 RepID=A0ABD6BRT7_9EURY|nr:hypothetical protein [Halolamina litorea]
MDRKRVAATTLAALVLAFLLRIVPGYLVDQWVTGAPEAGILPIFGTVGQTVSALLYVTSAVEALAPTAAGVALGYWIARQAVDDDELRDGLRAAGAVGVALLGLTALAAVVVAVVSAPFLVVALSMPLSVVVVTLLGAVAGAGLERFDLVGDDGDVRAAGADDPSPPPADADAR